MTTIPAIPPIHGGDASTVFSHTDSYNRCCSQPLPLTCLGDAREPAYVSHWWYHLILFTALSVCIPLGRAYADDSQLPGGRSDVAAKKKYFETEIRPLLTKHCVECHGPDDQSGELRLDRQIHFQKGGGSGPVVVPGNAKSSRFIRAIVYQENDLQMPPDNKLSDQEIRLFTKWVEDGAYWPEDNLVASADTEPIPMADSIQVNRETHWSYRPIVSDRPPEIVRQGNADATSARSNDDENGLTKIDGFVRFRLSEAGLSPSPIADRTVLIHRASFSLLGVPPSYEQVQEFLADERPDAFARLIDRLLQDPHYGERWARHWLDIARYGDTKGYLAGNQETRYPFAFTYRDYVIDAFNSDKPFDDFIVEQIAADALDLEGNQRRSLAAMGFLTVGRRFMNRQSDVIDDQIDVISRGFLGMTVACARCHDHKYDPVPTADYYSLYGVFASSQEPSELPLLGTPEPSPQYDAFLKAQASKQKEVDDWLEERRIETEIELRSRVADYLVFVAKSLPQYRKGKLQFQGKRGPLRRAAVNRWTQYLIKPADSSDPIWELLRKLAAIKPEEFAAKAPGLLDQIEQRHQPNGSPDSIDPARADHQSPEKGMSIPQSLVDALREAKLQSLPEATQVFGDQLEAAYRNWVDAKKADPNLERLPNDDDDRLIKVLLQQNSPTSLTPQQMVSHLDQAQRNRYNQLRNGVNGVEVTHPGAPPRAMVLIDRPTPVEPVIFRRGVPSNRGDQVPRRFLQVLSHVDGGKPFRNGSGRLELARAIADPENPLTARVIVNRIWQHHFGEGLVRTPSDFGSRGEAPTHPKLLDHLASEFIADGWSIKRLQRRIMLSATWRQSSDLRENAVNADPENRLLWHMPRRRLEFEPLRDRLLIASGTLDDRVGGRSVMIHDKASRRGLYAYIDREDLPGLLASFDVPSPDASRAQRTKTTVPQQALYLMNSEFVIQQAKSLAARTVAESKPTVDEVVNRIQRMYRFALSRDPDPVEARIARQFVDSLDSEAAGHSADGASSDVHDPWVQLAQVLLLCNEFTFVD